MTKFKKTEELMKAMTQLELYSKMMQRYCHDNDVSFEDYKRYEKVVEENKEIIFNLAMVD